MSPKHFLKKTLVPAVTIAITSLLVSNSSTYAADIVFSPAGNQLDQDEILDIKTDVGATISFDVSLDTGGLAPAGGGNFPNSSTLTINFTPRWDTTELRKTGQNLSPPESPIGPPVPDLLSGQNGSQITYRLITFGTKARLATFTYSVLPGLVNDGLVDFSISLNSAQVIGGGNQLIADVTSQFNASSQNVEVQPVPEPSSILGTLALGTIGVGALLKHKQNKQKLANK